MLRLLSAFFHIPLFPYSHFSYFSFSAILILRNAHLHAPHSALLVFHTPKVEGKNMNPTQLHFIKFFYSAALFWGWVWRVISMDLLIKKKKQNKKKKSKMGNPFKKPWNQGQKQAMTPCNFNSGPSIELDSNLTCLFLRSLSSPGPGETTVSLIGTASFLKKHFIVIPWTSMLFSKDRFRS